ncbi:hypothetical protein [Mucilaginibacter sp.]|uniref:hypothetical protein n=1 Tax=Mucilaginibacter sp. TaxID=1882438 RepID=UPI003D15242B
MKYPYIYITIFLVLFTATGCRKFIEIDPPKDQLATSNVFNENRTANSAMLGIYSSMLTADASPYSLAFTTGISGDELTNNNSNALDLYINAIDPANSYYANSIWTLAYNYIYQANAVYEGKDQAVTGKIFRGATGERAGSCR